LPEPESLTGPLTVIGALMFIVCPNLPPELSGTIASGPTSPINPNMGSDNDSAFGVLGDLIVFLIVHVVHVDVGLCFAGHFQGGGFCL
jgi:hypothetical protein